MTPKSRTIWRCQQCGSTALKWLGRCPDCGDYGTYVEEIEQRDTSTQGVAASHAARRPVSLADAGAEESSRVATGVVELDRVLGGGLVAGSLVLLGGEPGIGKSTLLLQASEQLSRSGSDVLYVCGEESPAQVGLRARRLDAEGERISLLPEVDIAAIERAVTDHPPTVLVVDSIQTVFDEELSGAPGSVGQVRACTARLMRIAKDLGVITIIVGHVTKEGAIAGPRVLEHMVDAVLYFEGDRDHAFRIVRAVKNRFGSVSEIGIFEMGDAGLSGVADPAALLLGERDGATPGSAVMAAMEGSRPLLVEVQALVTPTYLQVPRRLATGIDSPRLLQVIGVLERHAGLSFGGHDVYVTVAGGMRVAEPAVDLPLALALTSALNDSPVPDGLVAFGEVGLTGRIRTVAHSQARAVEAVSQGFTRVAAAEPRGGGSVKGAMFVDMASIADIAAILG